MHGSEKKHREKCLEWVRCVGFWETWVHKFGVSAQGSLSTMIVFSQSWSLVAVGWTFLKERCITNEQKTTTIYQPPKSNYQLGSPFLSWTWGKLSFLFDFVKVFVAFWLVFILLAFTNSPLVFEIISALRLWLVWDSRSGPTPSLPSTSLEEAGWNALLKPYKQTVLPYLRPAKADLYWRSWLECIGKELTYSQTARLHTHHTRWGVASTSRGLLWQPNTRKNQIGGQRGPEEHAGRSSQRVRRRGRRSWGGSRPQCRGGKGWLVPITQGQKEIPPWRSEELFHQVEKARSFLKDWASKWVRIEGYEILLNSASCAIDPDAVLHSTTLQRYVNINLNWSSCHQCTLWGIPPTWRTSWCDCRSPQVRQPRIPNCAVWQCESPTNFHRCAVRDGWLNLAGHIIKLVPQYCWRDWGRTNKGTICWLVGTGWWRGTAYSKAWKWNSARYIFSKKNEKAVAILR